MIQLSGDCGDVTASLGAWVAWKAISVDAAAVQAVIDAALANLYAALGISPADIPTFDARELL